MYRIPAMSKILDKGNICNHWTYSERGPPERPQEWTLSPHNFETYGRFSRGGWGREDLAGRPEKCRARARSSPAEPPGGRRSEGPSVARGAQRGAAKGR